MTDRRTYSDGVRAAVAIMQESASDLARDACAAAAVGDIGSDMARAEAVATVAAKVSKRLLRGQS